MNDELKAMKDLNDYLQNNIGLVLDESRINQIHDIVKSNLLQTVVDGIGVTEADKLSNYLNLLLEEMSQILIKMIKLLVISCY